MDYSDSFQPYVDAEISELDVASCDRLMKTLMGVVTDKDFITIRKLLIDIMLKGDYDNNEKKKELQNLFQSKYKLTINDPEINELIVEPSDMCFEDLDTDVRNQLFKKAREKIQIEFDKQHTSRTRKSQICQLTILSRKFLRF